MRVVAAAVVSVQADLPVHCLRHEVSGSWTFHLSAPSSERSKCGHSSPDHSNHQPPISMGDYGTKLNVDLSAPNTATSAENGMGSWTMVYDEAFEVRLGSKRFLAFSKFDESIPADGNIQNYKSDCSATQVGWYRDEASNEYGCFVAEKIVKEVAAPSVSGKMASLFEDPSFLQTSEHDKVTTQVMHQAHVDKINSKRAGWTAKVYKHLVNKTVHELNMHSGIPRAGVHKTQPHRHHGLSLIETEAHVRRSQEIISALPQGFDWLDKDGKNWVPRPINQGSCGSCYAVATVTMMTARRRIQEQDPDAEQFSIEFPLFCSEYNQGCDGGYPNLIAHWSHDVGLVPDSCAKYDTDSTQCSLTCDTKQVDKWRVSDFGYVGGFYGAANEANMMQEISNNGPVAVAIEPSDDFMYYSTGIYQHTSTLFKEWAKVDHAVLLTGWGEEDGQKYWRVQNSWGEEWGEGGTFRIRRGVDESAIEAQPVWAAVEKVKDIPSLSLYA